MGEHTVKQFIYLSQKQDRNTYSEKKGMGILFGEEEHSKEMIFFFLFFLRISFSQLDIGNFFFFFTETHGLQDLSPCPRMEHMPRAVGVQSLN